ncbi:uncharacterized protein LOC120632782 isoform X1 [Pararge aegeria]|uniref:uncharacterized protein LOC120632782 isoform X1 n=1 Tax=Pararge aegeria TaxID=116150 RepID=UPI0019D105F9|nr:uncharacterized protein LOC120632782 isoform X1 [Pararge aegeria]
MPCNSISLGLIIIGFRCSFAADASDSCNVTRIQRGLPKKWPCEWDNGLIPFAYNSYLLNPNRLVNVAHRGIRHIETRSCLKFVEYNPIQLAKDKNVTYLFFTFSDVLEYCCLPTSTYYRRRVVLITPLCTLPVQVAHVTLHAMGLLHDQRKPFSAEEAMRVLKCYNVSSSS